MHVSARIAFTFIALLGFILPVHAEQGIQRLRQFQQQVHTLEAHFDQVVLDSQARMVQQSSGTMYIERPSKFRWDYVKPYPQLIVGDGQKIWIYDSDLDQVTVKSMGKIMSNAPSLVLTGQQSVEKDFIVTDEGKKQGVDWVKLVPKQKEADFKSVRIGFDGKDLSVMELTDNFGQLTRIRFSDVKRNPKLNPKLFQFTPPKGVEVVSGD